MTILTKYLLRQNLNLLLMICGIGLGVYIFIELFDMLDDFLEAGVGIWTIVAYFVYRIPYILAQIFPAVFLISLLVQLGLMVRSRELLALQACSISMKSVTVAIVKYAVALSMMQLVFSQVLGVAGHSAAERIKNEELRNRKNTERVLSNIWFRENSFIVHMNQLKPLEREGNGLSVYVLEGADSGKIAEIIQARVFAVEQGVWKLKDVERMYPDQFSKKMEAESTIPLQTDLMTFKSVDPKASLQSLPIWQLGDEITRLKNSGSNIERLEVAWHSKLAYAASLVVMALLALAVISAFNSLYIIIPLGLVLTFGYYALFVIFVSAAEKGLLPPGVGAWAANLCFTALAGSRLIFGRNIYR